MLPSRYGGLEAVSRTPYVCLSCTLRKQQKRRYGNRGKESQEEVAGSAESTDQTNYTQNVTVSNSRITVHPANGDAQKPSTNSETQPPFEKFNTERRKRITQWNARVQHEQRPLVGRDIKQVPTVRKGDEEEGKLKRGETSATSALQMSKPLIRYSLPYFVPSPNGPVSARKKKRKAHRSLSSTSAERLAHHVHSKGLDGDVESNTNKHLEILARADAKRQEHMKLLEAKRLEKRAPTIPSQAPSGSRSTRVSSDGRLSRLSSIISSRSQRLASSMTSTTPSGRTIPSQIDSAIFPQGSRQTYAQTHSYHTSSTKSAEAAVAVEQEQEPPAIPSTPSFFRPSPMGIRAQLRRWQELNGNKDPMPDVELNEDSPFGDEPVNNITRLPDQQSMIQSAQEQDESADFSNAPNTGKEGYDGSSSEDQRFLKMGDLVEIEFSKSERESVVAVFVQSLRLNGSQGQFFTMQGRWIHLAEKSVQYSIPNWVSPDLVAPLLKYLPDAEDMKDEKSLMERAYLEDLSVPREVSAPLVKRMLDFHNESQEIYRRHAAALDGAHDILAHDTDLRYGSLTSAATTLLRTAADKLPVTALFTVRKALNNGGFAFNIDRRSHRVTGYLQIRSREQVRMVENVRAWIRQWQEDLAMTVGMKPKQRSKHQSAKGARVMYGFLQKARAVVMKSRQNRQPTLGNNVGPSAVRLPITPESDCIRIHTEDKFTQDEQEVVKFIESWTCSSMFGGLPRIESLPPLILQALGLYEAFTKEQGFMFLQELGTILPYENRVRFDQYLLLPSSQHSKPLQKLMESLLTMRDKHNMVDSMADLRHDWKDLPVFCIDDASAQEIDDGVSVEPAGTGPDGRQLHWVHVHVANPTAFFSRDHPLAKMARHMGESIYMPERTYMMLPRWTTRQHFSLEPNRPCMTFSAKLDEDGNTLENKITSGIIRNVIQLTPAEVDEILGYEKNKAPELTLTVGGQPPEKKPRGVTAKTQAQAHHMDRLKTLQLLYSKRAAIRIREGGISFENHRPEVSVWQSFSRTGLAWDHPFRKGSRTVTGDPVIQVKTRGIDNAFSIESKRSVASRMVQEYMLLAGDIAASWCAARQVPIVYRGTVHDPRRPDPKQFWDEQIKPHLGEGGTPPMHLGWEYVQTIGALKLATTPSKHAFLGLQQYAKVTSPLRRYGDMIHHWQIEAALRHEAETGRSLIAPPAEGRHDRSFLPFSAAVLDAINMGLQPRELMISRAKMAAEKFWITMLLFRKAVFGDDGHLPFLPDSHYVPNIEKTLSLVGPPKASDGTAANDLDPLRFYISGSQDSIDVGGPINGHMMQLNVSAEMQRPETYGLEGARRGDVWECFISHINVYQRQIHLQPVRLVGRDGAGLL